MQKVRIIHVPYSNSFGSFSVVSSGSSIFSVSGFDGSQVTNALGFGDSSGTNSFSFDSSQAAEVNGIGSVATNVFARSGFQDDVVTSAGTNIGLRGSQPATVTVSAGVTSINVSSGSEFTNVIGLQFGTWTSPPQIMENTPSLFFAHQPTAWTRPANSISDETATNPDVIFYAEASEHAFGFVDNIPTFTNLHWPAYTAVSDALIAMALSEDEEFNISPDVAAAANLVAQQLSSNNFAPPEVSRHGSSSAVFSWSVEDRSLYVTITPRKVYVLATDDDGVLFKTAFNPAELTILSLFSEQESF